MVCSGLVHIRRFLSPASQSELGELAQQLGSVVDGGFYECHNEKTKHMRMMNLGRTTAGKQHKLAIPPLYLEHALEASKLAHAACPSIPVLREPDMCVVNHYSARSSLSFHQDLFSERDRKLPVVSLSLGDSAEFQFKKVGARAAPPCMHSPSSSPRRPDTAAE